MIVSVLAAVPVGEYMTKHEAVPDVPATSAQGEVANVPVPLVVKLTVPPGTIAVGIPEESVTVAVHVPADPMLTDAQVRVVVVGRPTTVRFAVAPEPA